VNAYTETASLNSRTIRTHAAVGSRQPVRNIWSDCGSNLRWQEAKRGNEKVAATKMGTPDGRVVLGRRFLLCDLLCGRLPDSEITASSGGSSNTRRSVDACKRWLESCVFSATSVAMELLVLCTVYLARDRAHMGPVVC